jgi:methylglyoxal synthase
MIGHTGPLGGDIEIATEVLYGHCDVVVFFRDPQSPHPHIEDIRTLFAACMRTRDVLMFTNEEHARDWMKEVVRPYC